MTSERRLFDDLFASSAMLEVFSNHGRVDGMLSFEAALARAEASAGVIPRGAALSIAQSCRVDDFDFDRLSAGAALAGNIAIPLVAALTDLVGQKDPVAARFVHWGATSQDVIDTGLVLQLRTALELLDADLSRLLNGLAALADEHKATLLLGRTWLKAAPPVTFGMKAAGWLDALQRGRERLGEARARVLVIEFGGAVGTLAALGEGGLEVARLLAEELGLSVPDVPWHAQRDRVAEVGTALGLLVGSLGKLARDLALLMQPEVAEVREAHVPGCGGSSTMPHKQNSVAAAVILAAATRIPGLVGTLLSAMLQEHERGLGGWHAEWESLPEICLLASGALMHATRLVEGLEVDAARMRENVEATQGIILAEPVALALGQHLGRPAAHALMERVCRRAIEENKPLRVVLDTESEVRKHLSAAELERLCDPSAYLGLAETWTARVLARHRAGDRSRGS